jgi:hypothetical protein
MMRTSFQPLLPRGVRREQRARLEVDALRLIQVGLRYTATAERLAEFSAFGSIISSRHPTFGTVGIA